ncbi:hypothetical protein BH10CHL1_BH10CHL1_08210 [soil metagenome]
MSAMQTQTINLTSLISSYGRDEMQEANLEWEGAFFGEPRRTNPYRLVIEATLVTQYQNS